MSVRYSAATVLPHPACRGGVMFGNQQRTEFASPPPRLPGWSECFGLACKHRSTPASGVGASKTRRRPVWLPNLCSTPASGVGANLGKCCRFTHGDLAWSRLAESARARADARRGAHALLDVHFQHPVDALMLLNRHVQRTQEPLGSEVVEHEPVR